MSSEQGRPGFWTTLPGILPGAAGVVTARTGLIVALSEAGTFPSADPPSPASPPSPAGDSIAGHRAGVGRDTQGNSFEVTAEILDGCAIGEPCGRIRVSHLPCEGQLYLYAVAGSERERSVDDFSADSSKACTPGAGELFGLLADGTLPYTTTYDPRVRGVLVRTAE
jgi:hypothetical protein